MNTTLGPKGQASAAAKVKKQRSMEYFAINHRKILKRSI